MHRRRKGLPRVKVAETKTSKDIALSRCLTRWFKGALRGDRRDGKSDLYRFDAESGESTLIAVRPWGGGVSEDLSRVYFVSEKRSESRAAGKPNLYRAKKTKKEKTPHSTLCRSTR